MKSVVEWQSDSEADVGDRAVMCYGLHKSGSNGEERGPLFCNSMEEGEQEVPSLADTEDSMDRSRSASTEGGMSSSSSPSPPPPPSSSASCPEQMGRQEEGGKSGEAEDLKMVTVGRPPRGPSPTPSRMMGFGFQRLAESLTDYLCPIDTDYRGQNSSRGCCPHCASCNCGCLVPCLACTGGSPSDITVIDAVVICRRVMDKEVERLRKLLQVEIGYLMGCTSLKAKQWLDTLRDWLSGFSAAAGTNTVPQGDPDRVNGILLRNRAHVINAQKERIQRLRNEMHFARKSFPPAASALGTDRNGPIPSTRSLDDSVCRKCAAEKAVLLRPAPGSSSKHSASVSTVFLRAISGECVDTVPSVDSAICDGQLFYDSDPGQSRTRLRAPRRATSLDSNFISRRRPLQSRSIPILEDHDEHESVAFTLSSSDDDHDYIDGDNSETDHSALTIDVKNDDFVTKFTRELTNGNVTLVWHPSQNQNNNNRSPVCVQAWFEMGSRLRDKVIQPKFMWWAAYQPDLNRKKLSLSNQIPESVELLNIVRVLKPTKIDREQHPFAKLNNSFALQSNTNEVFLFEAFSEKERDRFVQGLKLVVARLASKIIVGDEDVFDEFFTPWGQSISPNGLSDGNGVITDVSECSHDSLDSFDEEGEDLFFKTEGKEIFRASPVYNK